MQNCANKNKRSSKLHEHTLHNGHLFFKIISIQKHCQKKKRNLMCLDIFFLCRKLFFANGQICWPPKLATTSQLFYACKCSCLGDAKTFLFFPDNPLFYLRNHVLNCSIANEALFQRSGEQNPYSDIFCILQKLLKKTNVSVTQATDLRQFKGLWLSYTSKKDYVGGRLDFRAHETEWLKNTLFIALIVLLALSVKVNKQT